ncbi:MAG: leucine--tRNA ligase [Candidatus Gracilibacteria bacterium]|nr:leucine--tRNA ligase [Candidatus Gracilibacteria bacterium]
MYNHKEIEAKWQAYWEQNKTFKVENDFTKPKYYTLDMFPYPSGAGLHVGHPEGMTANDIVARYKNACGFNVLHPMGRDAFGLPAENYAIKTGTHPRITTDANIANFKSQIKRLGFSYDWDREIDTTDPKYYKWTQWIFLKLFEKGLAYEQDLPINYCPSCKTGLANEEVLNDFTCERCGTKVEKRKIRQWVLAITKYADRLLADVDKLDWPESIKEMQRNWIGKSEGCEFEMKVISHPELDSGSINNDSETSSEGQIIGSIRVYTTRIDTVFGMTYAVLAPDHKDVMEFITTEQKEVCLKYIEDSAKKSDQDRTQDDKEKTGVFTGSYVINPFNGEKVPLWIGDYVLGNYGTGAVMAVPAHDERDFEFAKKYDLGIKCSIAGNNFKLYDLENKPKNGVAFKKEGKWFFYDNNSAFTQDGILVNSGDFTGLTSSEARSKLTKFAEEKGFGNKKTNFKLRDWLFSRQRYWGEPIPLIHLEKEQLKALEHINDINKAIDKNKAYILKRNPLKGEVTTGITCCSGMVRELVLNGKVFSKIYDGIYGKIICDYNLPLELPKVDDFAPSGDGQSPLAKVESFVNVKLADNLTGKRETNTMPQWGGSCWYYLRYMDNTNSQMLVDPEVEKYWGQVDSYVGGAEHAVLHLLYARFWHKFLFDIGVVSFDEPFFRLRNQGLILAHAFQRKNGGLLANDLVEEKDGKYFEIETGEEVDRIVSKMSKSLKNVINPDDIVEEYGADSLRLYEMYMAEFKDSAPWDTKGIIGVRRFLEKAERLFTSEAKLSSEDDNTSMKLVHKTIKKVQNDIENYKFNTAIASLIILVNNGLPKSIELQNEWKKIFITLLNPFAPHLAEELWERIGNTNSISKNSWPKYDEAMTIDDVIKIGVQVLGKLRGEIEINKDEEQSSVLEKARNNEEVARWLEGKTIVKEIYVAGKIVNIVVK